MIDVNVQVHNDHYGPVLVTAVWDDMTYFLGEVGVDETRIFRLPGYLVSERGGPRFLADPRGSTQEFLTDPVPAETARWIQWTLKRNLHPSRPHVM